MLIRRVLLPSLPVLFLSCAVQAQSLEERFTDFASWWPGTYDNAQQVDASNAADGAPMATRLHIRAVDLPAFGEHVVYAEWQALDDPDRVLRQRFYSFELDRERGAARLNLHIFPPAPEFVARTRGAHLDPAKVADLTPADMVPLPGCDVYFTWTGTQFEGAMDKGACAFKVPGTDVDIYSWSQMRRSDNEFAYLDGWFYPNGEIYQRMSNDWYVFERR